MPTAWMVLICSSLAGKRRQVMPVAVAQPCQCSVQNSKAKHGILAKGAEGACGAIWPHAAATAAVTFAAPACRQLSFVLPLSFERDVVCTSVIAAQTLHRLRLEPQPLTLKSSGTFAGTFESEGKLLRQTVTQTLRWWHEESESVSGHCLACRWLTGLAGSIASSEVYSPRGIGIAIKAGLSHPIRLPALVATGLTT